VNRDALLRIRRAMEAAATAEQARLADALARARMARTRAATLRNEAQAPATGASAFEMRCNAGWQGRLLAQAEAAEVAAQDHLSRAAVLRTSLATLLGREGVVTRLIAEADTEARRIAERRAETPPPARRG
jgi:hypothetical protein